VPAALTNELASVGAEMSFEVASLDHLLGRPLRAAADTVRSASDVFVGDGDPV
jgi:hypothetical protein